MALIGELNEFHKTRRRGLRRRKRNHHYVQKYMEIDKGKNSKKPLYCIGYAAYDMLNILRLFDFEILEARTSNWMLCKIYGYKC